MGRRRLHTKICDMLGIEYPVILAGMSFVSGAELTASVSEAGGLGVFGAFGVSADELLESIEYIKKLTKKPFGVDVVFPEVDDRAFLLIKEKIAVIRENKSIPDGVRTTLNYFTSILDKQLEIVVEHKIPVLICGLGNPIKFMPEARTHNIRVGALVGTVKQALRLEEAGVDFIVAQGYEAGGHTGRIGTMALVPQVVDAVKIPVLAAGGIGDGRGLAAALALGACGVVVGTRFIATLEAGGHKHYKDTVISSSEESWVISKAYTGKSLRTARNRWTEQWLKRENELLAFPLQMINAGEKLIPGGWVGGDMEWGAAPGGQIAGMIKEVKSAQEVVKEMVGEAERILQF